MLMITKKRGINTGKIGTDIPNFFGKGPKAYPLGKQVMIMRPDSFCAL